MNSNEVSISALVQRFVYIKIHDIKFIFLQTKNKFNVMNFDIPVENSLNTKYIHPLKEGGHENFNRVHSNVHREQAEEHQKDGVNRGLSQAVRKLADDGKDIS